MVKPVLAIAVLSFTLVGCAGGGTPNGGGDPTAGPTAEGGCGSIPDLGANDPNDLLAQFPDLAMYYNGFPYEVQESAWADWAPEGDGPYTAAIVMNPLTNPFQNNLHAGLVSSLEDAGVEIVADLQPPTQQDVPIQLQQLGQVIASAPDIIFFGPIAADAALELVNSAGEAGIPVVSLHNATDSPYAVSVGYNNVLTSMEVGADVLTAIDGEGTILRVNGVPGIAQNNDASAGFQAVLDLCPDAEIVAEVSGFYQTAITQQAVTQYLATNPAGVDAVFQSGTMGLGVLQAFEQSGLEPAVIADVASSKGTVAYAQGHPDYPFFGSGTPSVRIGEVMGEVGIRILAGQGPKINQFVVLPEFLTRDNIGDYYEDDWELTDPSDAIGDAGTYFPKSHLDQLFNNPDNELD